MSKTKGFLLAATVVAMVFTFSCSSDDGEEEGGDSSSSVYSGGDLSSDRGQSSSSSLSSSQMSSSSFTYIPPPPPPKPTLLYDMVMGGWSTTCPNLNQYPALINYVTPLKDDWLNIIRTCIVGGQTYSNIHAEDVAQFLITNNLNKYLSDFDDQMAASPYREAYLIYVNTSNYYRVLLIGYAQSQKGVTW